MSDPSNAPRRRAGILTPDPNYPRRKAIISNKDVAIFLEVLRVSPRASLVMLPDLPMAYLTDHLTVLHDELVYPPPDQRKDWTWWGRVFRSLAMVIFLVPPALLLRAVLRLFVAAYRKVSPDLARQRSARDVQPSRAHSLRRQRPNASVDNAAAARIERAGASQSGSSASKVATGGDTGEKS